MRERLLGRYAWAGALREEQVRLDRAATASLRHRERVFGDENHALFLHPARTALILMDDAGVQDAEVLCAALLLDSSGTAAPSLEEDAAAGALAAAVPAPGRIARDRLLEELLAAEREIRLLACAERLDLARHAHMVPGEDVADWIEEARSIYIPVAARTHPLIARRYEHWAGAREQRRHP